MFCTRHTVMCQCQDRCVAHKSPIVTTKLVFLALLISTSASQLVLNLHILCPPYSYMTLNTKFEENISQTKHPWRKRSSDQELKKDRMKKM